MIRIKQVPPYQGHPSGRWGAWGRKVTGEKIAPLRGRRAQLTGSGWDSATRGEGPRRNRWNWASPRWCSSPPSPCLSSPHPGCLSVWTKGREKIAVAEDKRGKRNWSSRPKRVRVAPTRPDPTHEAALGRPLGWDGHPTGAEDDGRRGPKDTGQPRRPRITGDGGGGRSVVVAAERSGTERNGGRWGSGAKAWCDVWPVATDTLD